MAALRAAKPGERALLAGKLIQAHVDLSESLMSAGKYPAAVEALRRAKGLTTNLAGDAQQQAAGQLEVRINIAMWRQGNEGRGLRAEYFEGREFDTKVGERVDPRIDFAWERAVPVAGMTREAFSARWTGAIVAPTPGIYDIVVRVDDRCRVWIDDILLMDNWNEGGQPAQAIVKLTGKPQPVKVEFCNHARCRRT
jgi:hypothetical protein